VLCEGVIAKRLAPELDCHNDSGSSAVGSGDVTSQRTIADTTTQGGRRTRGHPRDKGVVTGGRCNGGNCGGNASERAAGENLGEDDPDRWAPSVSDGDVITEGRPAHARRWAVTL
jgi:hypothetical protein